MAVLNCGSKVKSPPPEHTLEKARLIVALLRGHFVEGGQGLELHIENVRHLRVAGDDMHRLVSPVQRIDIDVRLLDVVALQEGFQSVIGLVRARAGFVFRVVFRVHHDDVAATRLNSDSMPRLL